MFRRIARWLAPGLVAPGVLALSGCLFHVQQSIDANVCHLSAQPRDVLPENLTPPTPPVHEDGSDRPMRPVGAEAPERLALPDKEDKEPLKGGPTPLVVPPEIPGSGQGPIHLPELRPGNEKARERAVEELFPKLEPLGPEVEAVPGPNGSPLTLADLQRLALSKSPLIVQAEANVHAARGAALQAGLHPNPTLFFEHDQGSTNSIAGLEGGGIDQVFKTANKLQLARAAAAMDLRNAELARRRAETDLMSKVRGGYFAVLVALENVRVSRALARFTDDIYANQVTQLRKGGTAAAYEPMQLRALAKQARLALIQAHNRYVSAWKQLASDLGVSGLPPTQIVGSAQMPYPLFDHAAVLAHALKNHTDVGTAEMGILKARYNLQLAKVTPVPDVELRVMVQKDLANSPNSINSSVNVSVPIPVWDRNQGGIIQAEANLSNAVEEPHRVRTALTKTLADAFERYQTNRTTLLMYRDEILPDSVRSYELLYRRYRVQGPLIGEPGAPDFYALVTAQQTLAGNLATYLATLATFWQSVVDVADLLQTDNFFVFCTQKGTPVVLPELPCCHPCAPLKDAALDGMHGDWPPAPVGPETKRPATPSEVRPMKPADQNDSAEVLRKTPRDGKE